MPREPGRVYMMSVARVHCAKCGKRSQLLETDSRREAEDRFVITGWKKDHNWLYRCPACTMELESKAVP